MKNKKIIHITSLLLTATMVFAACGKNSESNQETVTTVAEAPVVAQAPVVTEAPVVAEAPSTTEAATESNTWTDVSAQFGGEEVADEEVVDEEVVDESTYIAKAIGSVDAYLDPNDTEATWNFDDVTEYGSKTVFLVNEVNGDWYNVYLPIRPNGTTGWVHADQVEIKTVSLHVMVDQSERLLTVFDGDEVVLTTSVAVGTDENPSPNGYFYITDKLLTGNPSGAYGPVAFGISGFSDTLSSFAGGPGQIGVHGTNNPDSIGNAASHGCIRVNNEVILDLSELLPLGTPITIQA